MGTIASIIGSIVTLIVLAIMGVIIYYGYQTFSSFPVTSCSTYANTSAALGTENGPNCPSGQEYYGGVCYTDYWTEKGGEKTAVCTVSWGEYGGVFTECGIGIYDLNFGDECPMVGPGYHKTAVCTCQLRGVVTAAKYCEDQGIARTCKEGWDYYGSVCYQDPCPEGRHRSAICTCAKD
jgi:hypothetical protein